MKLEKVLIGVIATIMVFSIFSLAPTEVQAKSRIRLSAKSYTLNVNAKRILSVKGTKKKARWTTSNKNVVSISRKRGKSVTITAKKSGKATIRAKVSGKTLKCKVTVTNKKILIAYFSRTGTTTDVAKYIQRRAGGTLVRIKPTKPYPTNYDKCLERANKEWEEDARPEISTNIKNMSQYETVFIGYPIWLGYAPRPVCTFAEKYDFSEKKLMIFCTSASSGMGSSAIEIRRLCEGSIKQNGLSAYSDDVMTDALRKKIRNWIKNAKI